MSVISVSISNSVTLPAGTKVITNDGEWLTLARKHKGIIRILTMRAESAVGFDFLNEDSWEQLRPDEIKAIAKLL